MSALRADNREAELLAAIGSFTHDPLGYVLFNFPWGVKGTELEGKKLRTWQREFLQEVGERLQAGAMSAGEVIRMARASGHGIGKSALVAMLIKWAFDTFVDCRGVVTANTDTQLRTKTWPEVTKWHNLSLTKHWATVTATALESNAKGHNKTWRIDAVPWSDTNTEAFAGLHNEGKRLLLIFDEASAIADKVFEVAEGALTDEGTEIIWCLFGNPTRNKGEFREAFRKNRHRWNAAQIDSRTVEGINLVEIQAMVDTHGEDSDRVKVRVRGIFPSSGTSQFISERDIDHAFDRHIPKHEYDFAPVILTCDPAWEGDDNLEIGYRQGLAFFLLETIAKNDNDIFIANKLARYEQDLKADAVFIDAGYGTGIVSAGKTMGKDWRLVWFGGEANDKGYANKRAEMYGELKKWLKEGGVIPGNQELRDELASIDTVARVDGKIQLISKKDMKKDGYPSPNKADCLALSFAYPVSKKGARGPAPASATGADYDPYA